MHVIEQGTAVRGWCLMVRHLQTVCVPRPAWFVQWSAEVGPTSSKSNVEPILMAICPPVALHGGAWHHPRGGVSLKYYGPLSLQVSVPLIRYQAP